MISPDNTAPGPKLTPENSPDNKEGWLEMTATADDRLSARGLHHAPGLLRAGSQQSGRLSPPGVCLPRAFLQHGAGDSASGLRGGCNLDSTCQDALNVVTVPAGTASAARGADQ